MDASSVIDILLPVVFIIVGIALIWLLVELAKTVKTARKTVEDLNPVIEDVKKMTADLQPAITKVDPLVDRVQLTIDAANLELMRLDSIMVDVNDVTGTLASTSATVDNIANAPLNVVNNVTERLRGTFRGRHSSAASAELADAAQARLEEQADDAGSADEVLSGRDISQAMEQIATSVVDQTLEDTASQQPAEKYYTYGASGAEAESASEE